MTIDHKLEALENAEDYLCAVYWSHAKVWPRTAIFGTHADLAAAYWSEIEELAEDAALVAFVIGEVGRA